MKFCFILFFSSILIFSNVFAVPSQAVLSGIDVAVLKAMRDIRRAVNQKTFGNTVSIAQVDLRGDQMADGEVEYFAERMEALLLDIRTKATIRFANDAFQGVNTSMNEAKMKAGAARMGAEYVAYMAVEKDETSFSLSMTVFEADTLKQVWDREWKASIISTEDDHIEATLTTTSEEAEEEYFSDNRLTFDISADFAADNQYFFGITSIVGGDLSNVLLIGLRYGAMFSVGFSNISLTRNVSGTGRTLTHTIGIPLTLDFYFSLINSTRRDYTFFDLEFYLKGGAIIGASSERGYLTVLGTAATFQTPYTFFWKPLFSLGFNFLFNEKIFFYVGTDLGSFLSLMGGENTNTEGLRRLPAPFFVAPTVGVGYRF